MSLAAPPTNQEKDTHSGNGAHHGQPARVIDLFCGAGGMTLGFATDSDLGFEPVWANDMDSSAVATFNANFGHHAVAGDIIELLEKGVDIPRADVVIGGPPCQGFSLLNRNRVNDPRKHLWRPFLDVVGRSGASVFVMENVPQLIGSPEHHDIDDAARELGFRTTARKLLAADYGVPQLRWRAFVIGVMDIDPRQIFPPPKTHSGIANGTMTLSLPGASGYSEGLASLKPWRTVRDAIADLPPPVGTEIRPDAPPLDLHFGRNPTPLSLRRYKTVSEEGMNRFDLQRLAPDITPDCWIKKTSGGTDLFGRMWWDKPSPTIRTEFFKPEKGRYLHPSDHRPITHREAARLQGFPDDFEFVGSKTEIARQIGNAVPPPLAAAVAHSVASILQLRASEARA